MNPTQTVQKNENPLGYAPIKKLLIQFAIPSIVGNLVNALYNIVDQIFIGQGVGVLGNAATNVAFPITSISMALSLMIGIGAASVFNLELGKGKKEKAKQTAGTAFGVLVITGLVLCVLIRSFLKPLMMAFGAQGQILDYSMTYAGITSLGLPFLFFSTGGNPLVRSDGSARYSMLAVITGAALNVILDPIFIFVFHLGVAGAAWATVISQMVSAVLFVIYLPRFKTVHLKIKDFIPKIKILKEIVILGLSPLITQLSLAVMQIVLNNLLRTYGANSIYGSDIPLAVAGIVSKINMIFISIVLGISQGAQPITGYNYGAGNYSRVRAVFKQACKWGIAVSVAAFLIFELFPRQIISIFGSGNDLYYQFATSYLRIFLFCTFLNGLQSVMNLFFSAIGKGVKGGIISLLRQIIFLVPLLLLFSYAGGIEGIKFAGPVADTLAFAITLIMVYFEFKGLSRLEEKS